MRKLMWGAFALLAGCLPAANVGDLSTNDAGDLATFDLSASVGDMTQGPDLEPPDPCLGLAYCETFDSYTNGPQVSNGKTVGPWKIGTSGNGVSAAIDASKTYGGSPRALHITFAATNFDMGATSNTGQSVTFQAATVAAGLVSGNNLFGRAMVYYSGDNGDGFPVTHSEFFNASGTSTAQGGSVSLNVANGGGNTFLNYHPFTPAGSEASVSGGSVTLNAWHCVQWEYDGSGATPKNEAKLWIDGAQVIDATTETPQWAFATPWSYFDFGLTHYQASPAIEFWMDDFAVNGSMIACPAAD